MKTCSRCEVEKPLADFSAKSGQCKPCKVLITLEWAAANPEKRIAQSALYRERHRETRNAKARAYARKRQLETPELVRANRNAFAKTPKGVMANRAARHRRRGAPMSPEARVWSLVLLADPCVYCGETAVEIDHVVPISEGGTSEVDNLAAGCRSCNAQKNDESLLSFLLSKVSA